MGADTVRTAQDLTRRFRILLGPSRFVLPPPSLLLSSLPLLALHSSPLSLAVRSLALLANESNELPSFPANQTRN